MNVQSLIWPSRHGVLDHEGNKATKTNNNLPPVKMTGLRYDYEGP